MPSILSDYSTEPERLRAIRREVDTAIEDFRPAIQHTISPQPIQLLPEADEKTKQYLRAMREKMERNNLQPEKIEMAMEKLKTAALRQQQGRSNELTVY